MEKPVVCVTGASGFIASWIVCKLLERGYAVHAMVRNPDDDTKCRHLKELQGAKESLKLFKADLLDRDSLVPPIRGCYAVFHTACPFAMQFDNPEDVLAPGIQGTETVMSVCSQESIKRVVMTSSGGALYADPNRPADKIIDESCWSDIQYCKEQKLWYTLAKTESEKLAWKLAKEKNFDLVVICPAVVCGPILQPTLNASSEYFTQLVNGSSYPNKWVRIVDVRDVAEAHILALENPSTSGRYYCCTESLLCKTVVEILKRNLPHLSYPDKCEAEQTTGIPPELLVSNQKFKALMGGKLIPYEQSLVDTIVCLQDKGLIKESCD